MSAFAEKSVWKRFRFQLLFLVLIGLGIAIWKGSFEGQLTVVQSKAYEAKALSEEEKKASVLPVGFKMTKTNFASICGELSRNEELGLRVVYVDSNGHQTRGSEISTGRGLLVGISIPALDLTEVALQLHKSVTHKGTFVDLKLSPSGRRTMSVQRPLMVDEHVLQHCRVFPQTLKLDVEVAVFITSTSRIVAETMSEFLEHRESPDSYMIIYAKHREVEKIN